MLLSEDEGKKKKKKRREEEMKAKFHLQLVTEMEGCHQSFPFLAMSGRLEDKS